MPSQPTADAQEFSACLELRVITNEAADVIKAALAGQPRKKRVVRVRSSWRAYGVGLIPFTVDKAGSYERRFVHLTRLVGRDFVRSELGVPPRQIAVLDNSAFHHEDLTVKIRTGASLSSPDSFFHPQTAHLIRFWIDFYHELGDVLATRLTADDHKRLRELGDRAAVKAAASVKERREALQITESRFADELDIPTDDVARIEKGEITITSSLLDQIEATFDRERVRLGLKTRARTASGTGSATSDVDPSSNGKVNGSGLRRVKIEGPATKRKKAPSRGKGHRKEPAKTAGGRLRERRRKARINQKTLADHVGISVKALSSLEQSPGEKVSSAHKELHAGIRHIEATRPKIIM